MTRLSNDTRDLIYNRIMKDLPVRNFIKEIHTLIQEEVMKHAPKQVRELYDNTATREYLGQNYVEVRKGNRSVSLYSGNRTEYVYGLKDRMTIRMDDAEHIARLPEGSLYTVLVTRLTNEGLVTGFFEQEDLRESVRKRVRNNLKAATTVKKLYEVLEPELHHHIPKEDAKSLLPTCVAPVVDDLKKLGAVLPEVPKAEVKA